MPLKGMVQGEEAQESTRRRMESLGLGESPAFHRSSSRVCRTSPPHLPHFHPLVAEIRSDLTHMTRAASHFLVRCGVRVARLASAFSLQRAWRDFCRRRRRQRRCKVRPRARRRDFSRRRPIWSKAARRSSGRGVREQGPPAGGRVRASRWRGTGDLEQAGQRGGLYFMNPSSLARLGWNPRLGA